MAASKAGDVEKVLSLMAEDVVFLGDRQNHQLPSCDWPAWCAVAHLLEPIPALARSSHAKVLWTSFVKRQKQETGSKQLQEA
jgi:hypothetical protein